MAANQPINDNIKKKRKRYPVVGRRGVWCHRGSLLQKKKDYRGEIRENNFERNVFDHNF
jgi:hypothetical protein